MLASYLAAARKQAYLEPVSVGDCLFDMPVFLDDENYIPVPLEATYEQTWRTCPAEMRRLIEVPDEPLD
jgi:hypothetical protein